MLGAANVASEQTLQRNNQRNLYHIDASRQNLQRNQQTVLISQSCIKAKSTEKSANGTYITKLHQGKLHREISKRYLYHKAASRQNLQRNQQTVFISQSCIKANYTEKSPNGTYITKLHQGKVTEKSANGTYITKLHQGKVYREISKRHLYHKAASRKTTQRNQQTILALLHQDKFYRKKRRKKITK